ncbi:MAG: hypothetical protein JWM62_1413 [Frankiales bacterium]|nr:hypothetical protein [Frankiales bacterium]
MASVQECESALLSLAEKLAAVDPDVRAKYVVNRTLACRIPDLDVVFLATLNDEGIEQIRCSDGDATDGVQVRIAAQSDDLLALLEGQLSPPVAWATGRLKVQASPLDLLKLRALL